MPLTISETKLYAPCSVVNVSVSNLVLGSKVCEEYAVSTRFQGIKDRHDACISVRCKRLGRWGVCASPSILAGCISQLEVKSFYVDKPNNWQVYQLALRCGWCLWKKWRKACQCHIVSD
jgi:hypothetical protein